MSWNGKEIAAALFGNGVDGDVVVSTSITLTRDMYYNSLQVTGAGTINQAGYRIFARTWVECNGIIHSDGTSATTSSAPVDTAGTTRRGVNGSNGATGVAGVSSGTTTSPNKCAKGGNGGAGTGGAGGTAGSVFAISNQYGGPNPFLTAPYVIIGCYPNLPTEKIRGATGGGGGGGNGVNAGGGGGCGAGTVVILCNKLFGTGTIRANGGNGAAGTAANCGGGGGGGGGTAILVTANDVSTSGLTFTFNGGTGGASGGGAGVAGSAGSNGTGYYNLRVVL